MKALRVLIPIVAVVAVAIAAQARDFYLEKLPQAARPTFSLSEFAQKQSYYDFMHKKLGPKIVEDSETERRRSSYEIDLRRGAGISVKLNNENYNVHVNFPNASTGGRSFGWTDGQVGDWSDKMYLDNLQKLVRSRNRNEISQFYETIIEMLGACESDRLGSLNNQGQRVAANFLAIFSAEQYRSMVPDPHKNWDDALLEVTLLGAFHGGQTKITKFYLGRFAATAKEQGPGVYARIMPGPKASEADDKTNAELNDYWQFSANPDSIQSGINITRYDFEKMGKAITKFESEQKNNNLALVEDIVGKSDNVIKAIANYFTQGKSKSVKKANALAERVSNLMMDIYDDANAITTGLKK